MHQRSVYIVILTLCLTSCEDLFHETNTSIGAIQNYDQLSEAAEGTWAKLTWALNWPDYLSLYYQNLKADDLTYRGPSYHTFYMHENSCKFINESDIRDYFSHSTYLYESFYLVIASANNILSQFQNPHAEEMNIRHIMGEMLLLRAYCHFRLMRTYGQIPIVQNIEVDYNLIKPNFSQIYEFIEEDLLNAILLLPLTSQMSRMPGKRPGKGTAKALLAEVYLFWAGYPENDSEKYLDAAKVAGELIDSTEFYGFELLEDFANLWDEDHILNNESVFCLYFSDIENVSNLDQINLMYSKAINPGFRELLYVHRPYFDPIFNEYSTGRREITFFAPEHDFFNRFPNGYRKDITFFTDIYVPGNYYESKNVDTGYFHLDTLSICNRAGYRKFYFEETRNVEYSEFIELGGISEEYTPIYLGNAKVYLYRFAHTLLTYAEAKARSGQLDESAYEAVNRIRRRANNVDQFTPSVFDLTSDLTVSEFCDSVVWERAYELAGEPEGRYFDLLRLEKLEDLKNYRHPEEMSPPWKAISKDEYFLPIPEEDILLNPNFAD